MKRAPAEVRPLKSAAGPSATEASDRFPKRARNQAVFFSPSKAAKVSRKAKDAVTVRPPTPPPLFYLHCPCLIQTCW